MTPPTDEARQEMEDWLRQPDDDPEDLDALAIAEEADEADEARAGEPRTEALERLRTALFVYDAMPVHEVTEDTIRGAEGRIIEAAREAAAAPALDVERLAEAMQRWESDGWKDYEDSEITYERQAQWVAAEYQRLSEKAP